MNKELKDIIQKDIFRHYGKTKAPFGFKWRNPQLYYTIMFRICHYHYIHNNRIRLMWYKFRMKHLSNKTHIQIPFDATIGEGFYIGHCGRVIINGSSKIGKNVNVGTGITIGYVPNGTYAGVPTIGNNVWIGTNAVIVGNITIGDDVVIAPNCFVNRSIPSNCVVIGNPAIIKLKDNATEGYIIRVKE